MNMNQSMKDFSTDLESRLDRAYKSGATKKFGFDPIANKDQLSEDRSINKIVS
jgi:hypothetical protein